MPSNEAVRSAISRVVASASDFHDDSLEALTSAARDAVPGADYASVTIVHDDGRVETLAPTDPLACLVDDLQGELKQGPCYDAATNDTIFIAEDLAEDERWPQYGPKAAALGVTAQMGIDLRHPGNAKAALNLYSNRTWVFVDSLEIAELFATHAALVLGFVTATNDFESALTGRKTIGQALGIVMERYSINEDRAFQFLVRVSQDSNVKVREVAADIVAGVNRRNTP